MTHSIKITFKNLHEITIPFPDDYLGDMVEDFFYGMKDIISKNPEAKFAQVFTNIVPLQEILHIRLHEDNTPTTTPTTSTPTPEENDLWDVSLLNLKPGDTIYDVMYDDESYENMVILGEDYLTEDVDSLHAFKYVPGGRTYYLIPSHNTPRAVRTLRDPR